MRKYEYRREYMDGSGNWKECDEAYMGTKDGVIHIYFKDDTKLVGSLNNYSYRIIYLDNQ